MHVNWDGRCSSCGTKVVTAGCPNLSCPNSAVAPKLYTIDVNGVLTVRPIPLKLVIPNLSVAGQA